jgi:hypothetical protein
VSNHQTGTCDCGKPIPAASTSALCDACLDELRTQLEDLPSLVDDLNLTITRQTNTGDRNGGRSSADPVIAWDERASKALAQSMAMLVSWAKSALPAIDRELAALEQLDRPPRRGLNDAGRARRDRLRQYRDHLTGPRWIITSSHRLLVEILKDNIPFLTRVDSGGPAFKAAIARTSRQLLAAADTPAPRLYLGTCLADPLNTGQLCPEEVYALDHSDQGKDHVCDRCRTTTCRTCGTEHDVRQRREWLAEALDDRLATASDIARGLATTTGTGVREDQIRWWERSGRLAPRGRDQAGRRLYRVGDVRDLAIDARQREQEKTQRRAEGRRGA